jgi:hypothetical protein
MSLLRLKRCHACDQWHSSRMFTPLTGWHCKLRSQTLKAHAGDWDIIDKDAAWLITNGTSNQPFFLFAGLNIVHPPYITTQKYLDRIDVDVRCSCIFFTEACFFSMLEGC